MLNGKIIKTIIIKVTPWLIVSSVVISCSSNSVKPKEAKQQANTQQSTLDKTFEATARAVVPAAQQPIKQAVQKTIKATPVTQVRRHVPKVKRPPIKRTPPPVRSVQKSSSWGQQRANALTGDFSENLQTIAFINKMVNTHGFDRRHLNYIFSNAKATTFLKKMAYQDANPIKRTGKTRKGSWTRYRNLFLTDSTINQGVQFWKQNRVALQRAEQQFGVPQEYILGIIGVETRYGGNVGKNRAIDALANMGFSNARRGKYFQSELESYLLLTRRTGLDPLNPMASYAGALGLSQFMPSNVKRYGVDYDGNGSCNLWTPADAIGSVANYLKKHGWKRGRPVAVLASTEGKKHRNFKHSYKKVHSLSKMQSNGIYPLGPMDSSVRLLKMSTYSGDEVWLAGYNFYVITRYNHSSKYAMAVHQLAQALKKRIKPSRLPKMASLD